MTPAVWLLDVDGVINVQRPGWGGPPRHGDAYANRTPWRMRWAPRLVDRIRAVHLAEVADVRWCSTWCPHSDELERLFRLPALTRALLDDDIPAGPVADAMKLAAAYAVLDSGARLIWTDDTAVPLDGADRQSLVERGALLIRPTSSRGLQPDDLDLIEAFARTGDIAAA